MLNAAVAGKSVSEPTEDGLSASRTTDASCPTTSPSSHPPAANDNTGSGMTKMMTTAQSGHVDHVAVQSAATAGPPVGYSPMSDSGSSSSSCTSRTADETGVKSAHAGKDVHWSKAASSKVQAGPFQLSAESPGRLVQQVRTSSCSSDSPTKGAAGSSKTGLTQQTSSDQRQSTNFNSTPVQGDFTQQTDSSDLPLSVSTANESVVGCVVAMTSYASPADSSILSTASSEEKRLNMLATDQKNKVEVKKCDDAVVKNLQQPGANGRPATATTSQSTSPPVKTPGGSSTKSSKHESLKEQKKNYRSEKKRAAKELLSTLKDPSVIIMAEWLKVRGSLKSWTKFWCVLKPGLLLLYKSHKMKSSHWVATVLLNTCELLERPSKKDGFCFKLFHPLDQSIWATKGPKGETIGALTQPLPYSYLIFRAPSDVVGKCWMDALELAIHCSSLVRPITRGDQRDVSNSDLMSPLPNHELETSLNLQSHLDESECENHFRLCDEDLRERDDHDHDDDRTDRSDTEDEDDDKASLEDDSPPVETAYERNSGEELGQQGEAFQTEEVADEHKSLIWTLVKQVRPGMDLSKVVLPTFILEPRSFLDRLADFYYHADLLSEAMLEEDPFTRMKLVVRWYLSGFYKKPKGLKKPYNPILGEVFRCYWKHSKTDSRTFYISEQISHHPPVSAFYVSNRKDGFAISGSVLAKSKFYGNSLSAIMDGVGRLMFLKRGEDYVVTMPYAHCKGILIGTLTMELGGVVTIKCEKTGYSAEFEFKLKPFLGSGEASNCISGKIRLGEETLSTISGHWDQEIFIKDKRSEERKTLWNPTPEVKSARLPRFTVPFDIQTEFESERLWHAVSDAISHGDETTATNEKFLLEEEQRRASRERKAKMEEWVPRFFDRNIITGDWVYKFSDLRPWDMMNDVIQYERDFVIQTKTRHQTPIVHTMSIAAPGGVASDEKVSATSRGHSRQASLDHVLAVASRTKRLSLKRLHSSLHGVHGGVGCARISAPGGAKTLCDSESSLSAGELRATDTCEGDSVPPVILLESSVLSSALDPIHQQQRNTADQLLALTTRLTALHADVTRCLDAVGRRGNVGSPDFLITMAMMLLLQAVLFWWLSRPIGG